MSHTSTSQRGTHGYDPHIPRADKRRISHNHDHSGAGNDYIPSVHDMIDATPAATSSNHSHSLNSSGNGHNNDHSDPGTPSLASPSHRNSHANNKHVQRARYLLGLFYLFLVIVLWVGSSALIQWIFIQQSTEGDGSGQSQPFFLTYFSTSLFMIYLAWEQLVRWWRSMRGTIKYQPLDNDSGSVSHANNDSVNDSDSDLQPFTLRDTLHLSLLLCPIWFLMEFLYNASLSLTTLSQNTILSTTSGVFVLLFNWCFFREKLKWWHLLGVGATIIGSYLVYSDGTVNDESDSDDASSGSNNYSDGNSSLSDALFGDMLAVLAAIFYGLYTVTVKWRVQDDSQVNWHLLLGFLGLFNFIFFWPFFFYFHFTGIELFVWPSTTVLLSLLLNGLLGTVLADYLWARSILLTSPLVATMGLTLNIPCSLVIEWLWRGRTFGWVYAVGGLAVITGFVLVNIKYSSASDSDSTNSSEDRDSLSLSNSVVDGKATLTSVTPVESDAGDAKQLSLARSSSGSRANIRRYR